jgi:anti-sigma B factor antagonist
MFGHRGSQRPSRCTRRAQAVSAMTAEAFTITNIDGVSVVSAPDEIDVGNSGGLRRVLLAATGPRTTIVVDLSGTDFCDSSGLQAIILAERRARSDGGELCLVACTPPVLRILAVSGMENVIDVYSTLSAALAAHPPAAAPSR